MAVPNRHGQVLSLISPLPPSQDEERKPQLMAVLLGHFHTSRLRLKPKIHKPLNRPTLPKCPQLPGHTIALPILGAERCTSNGRVRQGSIAEVVLCQRLRDIHRKENYE